MIIVKSKKTGKFLRHHSGSANEFSRRIYYQVMRDKKFTATLPPAKKQHWDSPYDRRDDKRSQMIREEVHRRMYNAEALEARRYKNAGSAATSVGKFKRFDKPVRRHRAPTRFGTYSLPDHLEAYEIVAGNLCLVNPNDDEETKRKKQEDCK